MTTIAIAVVLGCAALAAFFEWSRQKDMEWSAAAVLLGGVAACIGGPWWAMALGFASLVGSLQEELGGLLVIAAVVFAIGLRCDWEWARSVHLDLQVVHAKWMLAQVLA